MKEVKLSPDRRTIKHLIARFRQYDILAKIRLALLNIDKILFILVVLLVLESKGLYWLPVVPRSASDHDHFRDLSSLAWIASFAYARKLE